MITNAEKSVWNERLTKETDKKFRIKNKRRIKSDNKCWKE